VLKYYRNSVVVHLIFLSAMALSPWIWHYRGPVMIIDGFDWEGGGGGGGDGGGGGIKKEHMGQVVPAPQKIPVPAKPAPVQKATKTDAWKVDKVPKKSEPTKETPKPVVPTQVGDTDKKEQSNVVSRGTQDNEKAGEGFDFGGDGKGGKGVGIGIGYGPGEGGGSGGGTGFGFSSYVGILRRRIWQEWTQSNTLGMGSNISCVVGLTVNRGGDVSNIKLEKGSGNSFYDNVAMRAVRNSSPLPPLPSGFPNAEQRFRIAFRLTE
jgi:TonB family protein